MRLLLLSAALALPIALTAAPAAAGAAQAAASTTTVRGTVLDPMKTAVMGASVTAAGDGGAAAISTTTDQSGAFTLTLPPGRYTITVTFPGFRDATSQITAAASGNATTDFVLQVAGVRESVTVTAPSGYQVPVITTATKTPTPLRDVPQSVTVVTQRADQGPDDDEHRRRHALRARHHGAPGREQPRPGHHPRQQLVGRLLRRRRARRRAVLPRPLQPRPRRGAQGTERDDLRPRRRRRRRQPRDARKPAFSPLREFSLQGGIVRQQAVHRRTSTSRSATRSRSA